MRLCEIDPYVRFAAGVRNAVVGTRVKVTDCRLFYVEEGQAQIHIGDACCHIRKNSLFYCCGGSTYEVQPQQALRLICINFDLTRNHEQEKLPFPVCPEKRLWQEMPVYFESVQDSAFLNSYFLEEDASWAYDHITELVQEYAQGGILSSCLCGSLLKTLLLRLHRVKNRPIPPKLATVQSYIRSHYQEDLTNKQLGELVGYHEYHLNRSFYAHTGMNLHQFLIKVRMEQAAYLILNTDLPLSRVAEAVGMPSYPHFSSCFKNSLGCSPIQYRRNRNI